MTLPLVEIQVGGVQCTPHTVESGGKPSRYHSITLSPPPPPRTSSPTKHIHISRTKLESDKPTPSREKANAMPPLTKDVIKFGTFIVTNQVFHTTPLSYALVNLKPLLPGHVLVSPLRPVPRLSDLTPAEVSDLFQTVQRVSRTIERVFSASALNIAVQDGADAGQSVPHVHAHVIPRRRDDLKEMGGTDAVYDLLQGEEGDLGRQFEERGGRFPKVDDKSRRARSEEEMRVEAEWLAGEMEKDRGVDS
ncbi:HIT-like protein [Aaosphaeria arxii CBS 175.79]|uniref:Bis(5'-adenosyl)-triphosphatase n=1 Tax=Aaosphaeria arxii CBS 175.79 TaxID=1450172 RepID=A0A6A5XJG6_9PLEO|nr:HIT-like protein [Aaosphaeria arxii CBS 175.79]KAF2012971.1 HIT-like protein [Aaosphaeria arxii CBS 175.79]